MAKERKIGRQKAVSDLKRELILDAARKVFEAEGLDGASLRAIAASAGYTPAALYFHFESKDAIYAEVLRCSLTNLGQAVSRAVSRAKTSADRLRAAAAEACEHDEARQVGRVVSQPISNPCPHARPAGDRRAGVHQHVGRIVIDLIGVHRAEDANFIGHRAEMWE